MTTEDLIKLAENYARLCYEGDDGPLVIDARQALLDALEAQAREIARLTKSLRYEVDCVAAIGAERDTLSAELAAIRAQEPVARVTGYYGGRAVVEALNPAAILPQNMALYASPKIGGV